jgi:hypothetical protein
LAIILPVSRALTVRNVLRVFLRFVTWVRVRYNPVMADATQAALTVGLPTLAVLIGILVNNSRLSDLRGYMDSRLGAMDRHMDARFNAVDARFNAVDARFDAVDRRIDERFSATDQLFQERLKRVEEVMDARLSRIEAELHIQ